MTHKRLVFVFALLFAASVSAVADEIVEDTNITLQEDSSYEFALTVFQDVAGQDPTRIFFDVDSSGSEAILRFRDMNIDEGSDWYLGQPGDNFNELTICADEFFFWGGFEKNSGIPVLGGELKLPLGESFYLGVNTGIGFDGGIPNRDIYGWVQLAVNGDNDIEMLDNAVAYGRKGGITIGSNTSVPEPTSLGWTIIAAGAFHRRRNA